MPRNITADQLKPGATIKVGGKIYISRIASVIEGEELDTSVKRARAAGAKFPTTTPHTRIVLTNAKLVPADPSRLTLEEQYVQENIYVSLSGKTNGEVMFTLDNKGTRLPEVFEVQADGTYAKVEGIEGELARDLDVTLLLNTYESTQFVNRGLGLQAVLVNEPLRLFTPGSTSSVAAALAQAGVAVSNKTVAAPKPETVSLEDLEGAAKPGVYDPETPDEDAERIQKLATELARKMVSEQTATTPVKPAAAGSPWDNAPTGGDLQF